LAGGFLTLVVVSLNDDWLTSSTCVGHSLVLVGQ